MTPDSANDQAPSTIAFGHSVAQTLQRISKAERAQEEERLAKRQRRLAGDGNRSAPVSGGTSGSTGALGEVAPDVDSKKGAKAKDKMDATARKALETQQHAATTKTMNMALGLSGAMGKKLSWMKKDADAGPSNPFLQKQTPKNEASKTSNSSTNAISSSLPRNRIFGQFREDKETGSGIQLRDIVSVLESDGKEKKSLQRAYSRFGSQKR